MDVVDDVSWVAVALADAEPLGDADLLGDADPLALAFGEPEPVGVAGAGEWLGQPDGVGPVVWLAWVLRVGLGFGVVLVGFGVAVVLLVPVALGVELTVALTLVVGLAVPEALAVPWLACTLGLDDRTEGLACAADASDPVGVGDGEQDGIAVGVPPPADTPAGPALPSAVPPPALAEGDAVPCELTPTV